MNDGFSLELDKNRESRVNTRCLNHERTNKPNINQMGLILTSTAWQHRKTIVNLSEYKSFTQTQRPGLEGLCRKSLIIYFK